jgi:threonine/homoserine/homoserine lactone efflux protein
VLLSESVRGGIGRGLRALAGVHAAFGLLLLAVALGVSVATPHGVALRVVRVAGGLLLIWLAIDGVRSSRTSERPTDGRRALPPAFRGTLAIILNPGAWLFLGAVASPLLASAAERGGTGVAVLAAGALVAGAALGDLGLVVLGGLGARFAGERAARYTRSALAVVLAAFGVLLVVTGLL